jgi:hypothetical protein
LAKSTIGVADPMTQGFSNQTAGVGRVPYTGGALTYPAGQPASGVFTTMLNTANGAVLVQFPLAPGSVKPGFVNFGPGGTASTFGPVTGTSYMSPDSTFFYANLTPVSSPTQRGFIFGGQPVNQSFYAPTPASRILAFTVNPDGVLGSPSQPQTIPFLPSNYGGTMPNATVSPLYIVTQANQQFGAYNAVKNPNVTSPYFLQASLAINGQGANQTSAFVAATGTFDTSNSPGTVEAAGPVRGIVFTSATAPLVRIASGLATVPDGNGNNLFGGNTLQGFVLDQNQYNSGNFSLNKAAATPFTPPSSTTSNYAFNQPVTATTLPANVGVTRTALNETGYFGGVMNTTASTAPYVLTGSTSVQTFPSTNRVAATFTGTDPFTSSTSGLNGLTLQFGALSTGVSDGRTAFIDNNIYAATESGVTPSQITTTTGGVTTTTTLPTYSSGSTLYPRLAMVTSATVPNTSLLPAGGLCAQCQFLQWGYWTGAIDTPNAGGTAVVRQDAAHINTWVAGAPTVTLPSMGVGSFSGNALGSVVNGTASYLAAGQFTNTYNFGTHVGSFGISNFDGKSVSGIVTGSGSGYSGSLSGSGLTGNANGLFFGNLPGNGASETGGNFALKGPSYLASGVFAGMRGPLVR